MDRQHRNHLAAVWRRTRGHSWSGKRSRAQAAPRGSSSHPFRFRRHNRRRPARAKSGRPLPSRPPTRPVRRSAARAAARLRAAARRSAGAEARIASTSTIALNGQRSDRTAIDTCGANNINGNAPNYVVPNGKCQGNGIGEIVRAFRIGTNQVMYGTIRSEPPTAGSVFDDGVDLANGAFNQSAAFTCNIVAAKVVQCVKGPAYAEGAPVSVGLWPSTAVNWASASVASATYNSPTGNLALTFSTAPFGVSVGSTLNGAQVRVSGLTGTGSVASLNGTWVITSTGSSGTVINLGAPAALTATITSASGSIAAKHRNLHLIW